MLTSPNGGSEDVKRVMGEMEEALMDRTLDMTHIVEYLGRKALMTTARLMDHSQNERIILDSAKELMDRSNELQKTQKLQVDSFSLDGKDVSAIVSALTESAKVAIEHAAAAEGLIEITVDNFDKPTPPVPLQPAPEAVE